MLKDKIKSAVISLSLLVLLVFSGIMVVFGDDDSGSSGTVDKGDGTGKTCSSCSCHYDRIGVYGVRLSLVDWKTGKQLSHTNAIDVFASDTLPSMSGWEKSSYYIIPGDNENKYSRIKMIEEVITQTSTNPSLSTIPWSSINKYTASQLGWDDYSSKLNFNFNSMGTLISYDTFVVSLYEIMLEEVNTYAETKNPDDMPLTNTLFTTLGINEFQTYTIDQLKGIHLTVEPIVTILVEGTSNATIGGYSWFYGTPTQLAYAFQEYNCDSDEWQDWSLSDSILKHKFGVMLYATRPCNTSGDEKYCTPEQWGPGSSTSGLKGKEIRKKLTETHESYGIGYIWLGALSKLAENSCDSSVGYLNDLYRNNKITQTEYENYIKKVINGKFKIIDEEKDKIYEVTEPQDWELLVKTNYVKYNGGLAACKNIEVDTQDCDAAVDYINKTYTNKSSEEYHNAIAQVRNGTFKYEVTDAEGKTTSIKIDKAYDFDMLVKSTYTKKGGVAACEDLSNVCEQYDGYTAELDDCITGKNYFSDIEETDAWLTCEIAYTKDGTIYSSDNTGHDAVETTNGGIVGNSEYCELFCYENFETNFPISVYDVKAGQTFTWGSSNGTFGTVKVEKKCSTQNYVYGQQGYRFEEWEEDYKDNEEALIKYYMNKASYEKEKNTITTSSSGAYTDCCNCCYEETGTNPDGSTYKYEVCPNNCKYRYSGYASSTAQSKSYSHSYVGSVSGSASEQSYATGYSYLTAAEAEKAAKDGLKAKLDALANQEYAKYTGKLTSEKALLEKIRQCTNNIEYLYKTSVYFMFSEPIHDTYGANSRNFSYYDNLIVDGSYNTNNVDKSQCKEKTVYSYTCSGKGSSATCSATQQKVLDCTMVTWNITGNYTYKYPTEKFQWYTLKTNSTLVNKENKGSEDEAFFYSVGFGLPTAFSLAEGTYELKVVVSDLGDAANTKGAQDYNTPNGHFAPITDNVTTKSGEKDGFEYSCIYEVENDMFGHECQYDDNGDIILEAPEYCDPKVDDFPENSLVGIDITFRLITLLSDDDIIDKAFPSVDGTGREPAFNWRIGEDEIKQILSADVYNTDQAMYEIMLDVNAIQYIREDNQEYFNSGKDPYTSYVDANNVQKVYCATGSGQQKYCASDFISELYNGSGLNYRLLGTCLPMEDTIGRAEHILKNGCNSTYTYPTINWTR